MTHCTTNCPTFVNRRRWLRVVVAWSLLLGTAQGATADRALRANRTPAARIADVELSHPVIGKGSAEVLLIGKTVYVNPLDLFSFAHILATESADSSGVMGYYINKERPFTIIAADRTIVYRGQRFTFKDDEFVVRPTGWYLKPAIMKQVFDLTCTFDFHLMRIAIYSPEELPAERELQQAEQRKHAAGIQVPSKQVADVNIPLPRRLFSFGALDWNVAGNYTSPKSDGLYSLQLGNQFVGGDLDGTLIGNFHQRLDWNATPWRWRFPLQNSDWLSTVLVGRRAAFSGLALADSMVGLQVTNIRPSGYNATNENYTNYTISDRTEPDWMVELYVNDRLVSFAKADQMGFYKFVIPIPYGSTDVRLRFIGPYGEEQTKDLAFRIPYTFLTPGTVGYTLTAGTAFTKPSVDDLVGKLELQVGVSSSMTLGGGLRYARLAASAPMYTPFLNSSIRFSKEAIASSDYYYDIGIRSRLDVSSILGLNLSAEYDQAFTEGRTVFDDLLIQDLRSIRMGGSLPWSIGTFQAGAMDYPFSSTEANFLVNGYTSFNIWKCVLSATVNASYLRDRFRLTQPSDLIGSVSLSLPPVWGVSIRPQMDGDYSTGIVTDYGFTLLTSISSRASLNLSAIHYIGNNSNTIQAGIGFTFPFSTSGLSAGMASGMMPQFGVSSQGSVICDPSTGRFFTQNHPGVRYGSFTFEPFLDRNNDGQREPDEPIIKNITLDRTPGTMILQEDGTMQLLGVEPYIPYHLKTVTTKLDLASLVPKYKSFEVTPPANGFAHVQLPILSMGQIEGYVTQAKEKKSEPISGIRIKIQHVDPNDTSMVVPPEDLLTYSNGEYYFLGLLPGSYRIYVDPMQLELLHRVALPPYREITIQNKQDGDIADALDFTLFPESESSSTNKNK